MIVGSESLDVLSETLRRIHMRSVVAGEVALIAPWGLSVEKGTAGCYFVRRGQCQIEIDGVADAVKLAASDIIVVPQGRSHCLRSGSQCDAVPIAQVVSSDQRWRQSKAETQNRRSETTLVCICFSLDQQGFSPLLSALPSVIHLEGQKNRDWSSAWKAFRLVASEAASPRPGSQAILEHLAQIVVIQAVRSYLSMLPNSDQERLAAFLDPAIGPAVAWLHRQPEQAWTVASLAEKVGMSRSAFAARFSAMVAMPPLRYLSECRLQKACDLLRENQYGLKEIAARVGYASEAAFSNAFKRWTGNAPGVYRRAFRDIVPAMFNDACPPTPACVIRRAAE
jgi:AraC-like DNA-binding protein/mannose-6-phosphate isomerase-like protein (cupin superfamily)